MGGFTIEDLKARHARLTEDRKKNREQLTQCQEREHGYYYVLGELESMIAQLEQRMAQERRITESERVFSELAALGEGEETV